MSEQENTTLVQTAYTAFQNGNIPGVIETLADDVQWSIPEIDGVPFSGKFTGHDGVTQFFTSLNESEEVLTFEPREFIAQNDRVVSIGTYRARVRETGREYETYFVHRFTIRDGKTKSFDAYTDTAVIRSAFQRAQSA